MLQSASINFGANHICLDKKIKPWNFLGKKFSIKLMVQEVKLNFVHFVIITLNLNSYKRYNWPLFIKQTNWIQTEKSSLYTEVSDHEYFVLHAIQCWDIDLQSPKSMLYIQHGKQALGETCEVLCRHSQRTQTELRQ